jgi:uncharacterized integral membrane protein
MKKAKLITAGILALLIVIVILQNTEAVETRLLFVTVTMPRALLLMITLVVGFAIGIIAPGMYAKMREKR